MNIQWYPGHMTKTRRQMAEYIKQVDAVCEVVDARIPQVSRNPDMDEIAAGKPRLMILNRIDLADPKVTAAWAKHFRAQGMAVIETDSRAGTGTQAFSNAVRTLLADKIAQWNEKGLVGKAVRVMVVGIPNVGKSTFLSRVTNARPKIANYHFTTLNPHLGVVDLDDAKGFVIADIPGLIEGASEGVGLGHEFLRHVERTKVLIHVVDAAGTEGRDPVEDIYAINRELENYSHTLARKPQVIAANKMDAIFDAEDSPLERIRAEFESKGIRVFPISAVSGQGMRELLYYVRSLLDGMTEGPTVFEQEYFPEMALAVSDEPFTVTYDELEDEYVIEGPRIEKMLGYTNLESEKGFAFFQNFLKESGILEQLEQLGIEEGDTVRMYGLSFDYYK